MTGYFAQIDDGVVLQVRKVTAERIAEFPDLYPGEWAEVLDMNEYPAPGYLFDETHRFRPSQPFPSWVWDAENKVWNAPVQYPADGSTYLWNETNQVWELMG